MEIRITKPKLVNNWLVNKLVWVRKPGPIAEVAIRNAAPSMAEFFFIEPKENLFVQGLAGIFNPHTNVLYRFIDTLGKLDGIFPIPMNTDGIRFDWNIFP